MKVSQAACHWRQPSLKMFFLPKPISCKKCSYNWMTSITPPTDLYLITKKLQLSKPPSRKETFLRWTGFASPSKRKFLQKVDHLESKENQQTKELRHSSHYFNIEITKIFVSQKRRFQVSKKKIASSPKWGPRWTLKAFNSYNNSSWNNKAKKWKKVA